MIGEGKVALFRFRPTGYTGGHLISLIHMWPEKIRKFLYFESQGVREAAES